MNASMQKEIRLLLPGFLAALALAIFPVWLRPLDYYQMPASIVPYLFWLGISFLSLSAFGREFSSGTFGLTLAQPVARARLWWTKTSVLSLAVAIVCGAWCASCLARLAMPRLQHEPAPQTMGETLLFGVVIGLSMFSGGLWTTLLLRQVAAAFWFTALIPMVLLFLTSAFHGTDVAGLLVVAVYSAGGLYFAFRYFLTAADVGWSGGELSLAMTGPKAGSREMRSWQPLKVLFWKEVQLHQFTLAGFGGFALLHVACVLMRMGSRGNVETSGSLLYSALQVFGGIWLLAPVLVGAEAVAEERKLGTLQQSLCLPVRSRTQLLIKFAVVVLFVAIVAPFLCWLIESIAVSIGADARIPMFKPPFQLLALGEICLTFLLVGFIAFYCSTLARSLIHGFVTCLVVLTGLALLGAFFSEPRLVGARLWRGNLIYCIGWLMLGLCSLWLTFRNFQTLTERRGFYRTNVIALAAAAVTAMFLTTMMYHRAWEVLLPADFPHGPPALSTDSRPVLVERQGTLTALLPNTALRVQHLWYQPNRSILGRDVANAILLGGHWQKFGGSVEIAGSNWLHSKSSFNENVAIQKDGSLWVSANPVKRWARYHIAGHDPVVSLQRLGRDNDWKQVVSVRNHAAIVQKTDGTLWGVGDESYPSKTNWPGLAAFQPFRLFAGTNWTHCVTDRNEVIFAWDSDSLAWYLSGIISRSKDEGPYGAWLLERMEMLDGSPIVSISENGGFRVGVRADGSLCAWSFRGGTKDWNFPRNVKRVGGESNWLAVAGYGGSVMGLKRDGTLWRWVGDEYRDPDEVALMNKRPQQLGANSDWLALADSYEGAYAVAADGTLWFWWYPCTDRNSFCLKQPLLDAPRRPDKIESLLTGTLF
jgi:ABC-type transport system involved in multi-copper enzyme maturation permease subunit